MSFEDAMRLTEILFGFALCQQSLEHLRFFTRERVVYAIRLVLALLLIAGLYTTPVILLLMLTGFMQLYLFQGPYNGGSDRMILLILSCMSLAQIAPTPFWKEMAMGYLAIQLTLSYFISGWVKLVNPEWRNGQALKDVFLFSAYPVSESLRGWASRPRVLFYASWYVMLFELLFPLALLSQPTLIAALVITGSFHLSNACFFGLNRFFWVWISTYPVIIWFQGRVVVGI